MPIPFVHKAKVATAAVAKGAKSTKPAPPSNEAAKQIAERLTSDRRASEAQLTSSSGVIVYQWDSSANTLFGTFVLGMYEGALATETGTKVKGEAGQLPGVYAIQTYTPTNDIFADGLLILEAVGSLGAYNVTYVLNPTPDNLEALGYVQGTTLYYSAIGYLVKGQPVLTVAWDNNLYTRSIGATAKEWGYRVVTPT
jgi:hypothetical protein